MFSQDDKINILIIRFKRIGDAILTLPICNSLKQTFPNASIDYVLYEEMAHLFYGHPYIDNVITIKDGERKNIFKYIKKVYKVTRKKYDIIIDVMSTPKSELFCLFSLKSPLRIGRHKEWRGYTYTHRTKEGDSLNKIDKFLKQLLPPISEAGFNVKQCYDFKFSSSDIEKEKYRNLLEKAGVDFLKPVVAFSIYSRVQHKIYPIEKMKQVVKYLIDKYDAQIIFFFSPDQKEAIQNIHREMGENKNIFSNIETPTIRDLVPFLENCDFYIGNEGGARHLAQGVGLPSLAIFSPSSELKEWLPFPSESNMGLSPYTVSLSLNMPKTEFESLNFEEKFNLITVEIICNEIDKLFKNNKRK
ncbi:glycosyltransferase family 9 protein [Fusobacterium russii]|uniref:glycosyltransferase family 9 protein n=1 Tax=Fusobacterium russii TaxID=854 RepID=UPI0003A33A12|nr:glycosyltransferase family 9 protein [Fusobacterium russii]